MNDGERGLLRVSSLLPVIRKCPSSEKNELLLVFGPTSRRTGAALRTLESTSLTSLCVGNSSAEL